MWSFSLSGVDTHNSESPLEDKSLPRDEEVPTHEEILSGGLMALEEAEGSESEEASREEGAVELVSALDTANNSFQCPAKEDTVNLVGVPGCKTCRYILVTAAACFNKAQHVCQRCYHGNLVSIHSSFSNFKIQCLAHFLNQGQVWIGGRISVLGHCQYFRWVDKSPWNFKNWAAGQPSICGGKCVSMRVQGGHWKSSHCAGALPYICSY
ncbi:bone marrow proteoglycan [Thomomys bottae]